MRVLGGSLDLVSGVISTLIGVISIVTLFITSATKSHDQLSRAWSLEIELARFWELGPVHQHKAPSFRQSTINSKRFLFWVYSKFQNETGLCGCIPTSTPKGPFKGPSFIYPLYTPYTVS